MSHWEKHRFKVYNKGQHPYKHTLTEFAFSNPAIPGTSNVESALNYVLSVLFPNTMPAVDTKSDLPSTGNTINDYRVVHDDGDGKQAAYRWEQREGDASAKWYKVADMDWSNDSILSQLLDVTQPLYLTKGGMSEIDSDGNVITGLLAGQTLFGGDSANQNLTLNANSGDGTGVNTGYVQLASNFRPTENGTYDLSTSSERWKDLYLSNSSIIDTMTLSSGSIIDSTGNISFGDENIQTSGNLGAAVITGTQLIADDSTNTLALVPGSITDSSGAISFGLANLTTTGNLGIGALTVTDSSSSETFSIDADSSGATLLASSLGALNFGSDTLTTTGNTSFGAIVGTSLGIDNLSLDGDTISSISGNNIRLNPNGAGEVFIDSSMTTGNVTTTGNIAVTGRVDVDNLRVDGNTLSSTTGNLILDGAGTINFSDTLLPSSDDALSIGGASNRVQDLYLSGGIRDGSNETSIASIIGLRHNLYRDVSQTQPAQSGDALFFDSVNGVWLASAPDSEVSHSTVSGLTDGDAGHTQFTMLEGRSGGQTIKGGTGASEGLTLESTDHATKGTINFSSNLVPTTSATFSGSWTGTDLGGASNLLKDIYSRGEFKGMRLENVLASALPSFSAQTPGRLYWASDTNKAYVDTGAAIKVMGVAKYAQDQVFDGSITTLDVDVSSQITDARLAQWQLLNNSNNYEVMGITIKMTSASNVRLTTNSPLPAGSYRLIGVE